MSLLTVLTFLTQSLVTESYTGTQTITGLPTRLIYPTRFFILGSRLGSCGKESAEYNRGIKNNCEGLCQQHQQGQAHQDGASY